MKLNRDWKRFLLVAGGLSVLAGCTAYLFPAYRNLTLLFFYSIPSNSVVPVPHEPAMIFFGKLYSPLLVAFVAVVGTLLACFLDYQAINFAFQNEKINKIRQSDVYRGAIYYFLKAPFLAVLIAALAPFIPFYIFRVLSPTSGYPLKRYMAAVFFGRLPRYYLFALMGTALTLPNLILVGGGIFCICAYLCTRVKKHLATRTSRIPERTGLHLETLGLEEIQLEEARSRI